MTVRNYGPTLLGTVPAAASDVEVYESDGVTPLTLTTAVAVDGSGHITWAADDGGAPPLHAIMKVTGPAGEVETISVTLPAGTSSGEGYVTRTTREQGVGGAPTAVAGAGAGTTPTALSVVGTDLDGVIAITTDADAAAGNLVVVTFHQPYDSAPRVMIEPRNAASAAVEDYVTSATTTGFTLSSANAPAASTPLSFAYHVSE